MVELADTPDLGSGAARCAGSSPVNRMIESPCKLNICKGFLLLFTNIPYILEFNSKKIDNIIERF